MRRILFIITLLSFHSSFSQDLTTEDLIGVWKVKNVKFREIVCRFGQESKPKDYRELIGSTVEFIENHQLYFYPNQEDEIINKEIHHKWKFDDYDLITVSNFKGEKVLNIFVKYTEENIIFYNGGYRLIMEKQ